ncbi:MAG: NADH-quinone oxidoreductase subunit A [Candidatus Methylacidiphilales bacterium]|nr:NADH-quinone oxidoreductase subunit A [Candidatus Methylacidiphilales bacterium]
MDATYEWNYCVIAAFIGVAVIFAVVPLCIAALLSPRKPGRVKGDTYECGLESKGDAWVQFHAQYYHYALAFVIFDVEALFLFPWAVAFTGMGVGSFLAICVFILILAESLVYLWLKGVLDVK